MSTFENRRQAQQSQELRVMTMRELLEKKFPPREYLLGPWLRQGESAMVWAAAGLGKSMLTMTMALAVAGGGTVLDWTSEKPRRVLLVDGEMHLEDVQSRLRLLAPTVAGIDAEAAGRNITILSRQAQRGGVKFPDLAKPDGQETVRQAVRKCEAELVILDNFATLAEVADENEAAAMTPVLSFLLKLKQDGVACILVHHSGKTGASYRGSSKLATTFEAILGLQRSETARTSDGAAFDTEWTKFRGQPHPGVTPASVQLKREEDGSVKWVSEPSAADEVTVLVNAVMSCEHISGKELAEHLGWEPSKVTRTKQKAIKAGKLTEELWRSCQEEAKNAKEAAPEDF